MDAAKFSGWLGGGEEDDDEDFNVVEKLAEGMDSKGPLQGAVHLFPF